MQILSNGDNGMKRQIVLRRKNKKQFQNVVCRNLQLGWNDTRMFVLLHIRAFLAVHICIVDSKYLVRHK